MLYFVNDYEKKNEAMPMTMFNTLTDCLTERGNLSLLEDGSTFVILVRDLLLTQVCLFITREL